MTKRQLIDALERLDAPDSAVVVLSGSTQDLGDANVVFAARPACNPRCSDCIEQRHPIRIAISA